MNAITNNLTCDDVTEDDVETRFNYYETVDGQAIIVFPSDPVTCHSRTWRAAPVFVPKSVHS